MTKFTKFFRNKKRALSIGVLTAMAMGSLGGLAPMAVQAQGNVVNVRVSEGSSTYTSNSTPAGQRAYDQKIDGADATDQGLRVSEKRGDRYSVNVRAYDINGEVAFSTSYDNQITSNVPGAKWDHDYKASIRTLVSDGADYEEVDMFRGFVGQVTNSGESIPLVERLVHYGYTSKHGTSLPSGSKAWKDYDITMSLVHEFMEGTNKQYIKLDGRDDNRYDEILFQSVAHGYDPSFVDGNKTVPINAGRITRIKDTGSKHGGKDVYPLKYMHVKSVPEGWTVKIEGDELLVQPSRNAKSGSKHEIELVKVTDEKLVDPNGTTAYGPQTPVELVDGVNGGDPTIGVFRIRDNGATTVHVEIKEESKVMIENLDLDTGEPIKGSTFRLKKGLRSIAQATTGDDGIAHFEFDGSGEYSYEMIDTPAAYILSKEKDKITVLENGMVDPIIVLSEKLKGALQFNVQDGTDNEPLSGVEVTIFDNNDEEIDKQKTRSDGIVKLSGILGGAYYAKVTGVPKDYAKDGRKYDFDIRKHDEVVKETLEVARETTDVIITKRDDRTGEKLEGAKIVLFDKTTNEDIGTATTNRHGIAKFPQLEKGRYFYTEIMAPKGYILDKTEYDFDITNMSRGFNDTLYNVKEGEEDLDKEDDKKDDKKDDDKKDEDKAPDRQDLDLTGNGYIEITIRDYSKGNGYIEITIRDYSNKPVQGQKIAIYKDDGNRSYPEGRAPSLFNTDTSGRIDEITGTLVDEKMTDSDGRVLFGPLDAGNYFYREVGAADRMAMNKRVHKFTIDGKTQLITRESFADLMTLRGLKTDKDGNPLAGAEFGLFDSANVIVMEAVSDKTGLIEFVGVPQGHYVIKEIGVPDGHQKSQETFPVEVTPESQNKDGYDFEVQDNKLIKTGSRMPIMPVVILSVAFMAMLGFGAVKVKENFVQN